MIRCTIVIPTYNRPGYLKRILSYYNDSHVVCNIIIADGSSDEIKKLNGEAVSSFPGLKIQHLEKYPFETPPLIRIADALTYVNTPYCVFCADDDFVTMKGIRQSVDFLEHNPDFTAAHGLYTAFRSEEDEQGKQQFYWIPAGYAHESITSSDPAMRFSHHLSEYSQTTFYAVHRTAFLKMIYAEFSKSEIDALFGELLLSMLTVIYGKLKYLDVLYAARDASSAPAGGHRPTLRGAIDEGVYDEKYAKFRDCLATHLSKQSQLDIEASKKVVDEAMAAYKKKYHTYNNKIDELVAKSGFFLTRLDLPDWIDRGIRKSYARITRLRRVKVNKTSVDMLFTSPYYEELSKIRQHVLAFKNKT